MIGENRLSTITVAADEGTVVSADAVSLGLIVTELVINALKYAFPDTGKAGDVAVRYEINGHDWKLSVCDDGIGRSEGAGPPKKGGLGTSLVKALAHQLDAKVETVSSPEGMKISISHSTFVSRTAA